MPIDAGIYQLAGRGVKSVADYDQEASQVKQNKLAEIMSGMKMDEYKRGVAEENQIRELTRQSGGDMNKLSQLMYGAGNYKQGAAVDKSIADRTKLKNDSAKTEAEVLDKNLASFRSVVPQVNTPEQAGQYVAAMYDHPVLGKFAANFGSRDDVVKRNVEAFAKDPRAWTVSSAGITADKLLETLKGTRQNVNLGNVSQGTTTNYYGEVVPGQTTTAPIGQSADNKANNDRMAADAAAGRSVTMRGQNLTDARSREANGKGQYDSERGLLIDPRTGQSRQIMGADGQPIAPKAASKALTEGQAKAVAFASRMENSSQIIDDLAKAGREVSVPGSRAGYGVGAVVSAMQPGKAQELDQAKRDFINAVLRRESGAVISDSEFANAEKQYFPQVNEGDGVKANKSKNRRIALEGMKADIPASMGNVTGDIINKASGSKPSSNIDSLLDKYK